LLCEISNNITGNVLIHETAKIEEGSVIGPNVVIGPGCVVNKGCRIKDTVILSGV